MDTISLKDAIQVAIDTDEPIEYVTELQPSDVDLSQLRECVIMGDEKEPVFTVCPKHFGSAHYLMRKGLQFADLKNQKYQRSEKTLVL